MNIGSIVKLKLYDCIGIISSFIWMDDEDKVFAVVTTDDGVRYADSEDLEVICK